ncbi:MAG: hypothetical protein ACK4UY_04750 [Dietzia sp.]
MTINGLAVSRRAFAAFSASTLAAVALNLRSAGAANADSRVDAFVNRHNNRYPLYPGQPAGSPLHGQCTALAEIYHREVCGGTSLIGGYGWQMYGNAPGSLYHKVGAGVGARKGDMAVWNSSRNHIAIVLDDLGGSLRLLSANNSPPFTGGNAQVITMTKTSLTGYLRPRTLDGSVPIGEGDFVSYGGHVYRIAGGAPVYVSSWAHLGGEKTVRELSAAEFNGLRTHPVDGTLISGQAPGHAEHGTVYVIAGGAPIYVTSFDHVGKNKPVINVDLAAIHRAGESGPWARLLRYPSNGTLVSGQAPGHAEHGTVYVIAGGAPIYVTSFDHVGKNKPVTNVSLAAIHNSGGTGVWNRLRKFPANGTLLSGQAPGHAEHGTVYVIAGGAPIYVTSFDHVGKNQSVTNVSLAAIHNSGGTGVWNHLRRRPADGTIVSGQAPGKSGHGTVFTVAGGAPICVYNWANIGGSRTATSIDLVATENAGKSGRWQYLLNYPADGTILLGYRSGKYYRVSGGRPQELTSPTTADKGRAVSVDQQAIDRAGQPHTHLLGPQSAGGGTLPSDGTTPPAGGSSFGS